MGILHEVKELESVRFVIMSADYEYIVIGFPNKRLVPLNNLSNFDATTYSTRGRAERAARDSWIWEGGQRTSRVLQVVEVKQINTMLIPAR